MSLFHESASVYAHCDGAKGSMLHDEETRRGKEPPTRRRHLRSAVSIPTLSSILRTSLSWAGDTLHTRRHGVSREQREENHRVEDRKQILYLRMRNAVSYEEWRKCACELDELENNNTWKETFESTEYNPELVQERLKQLDEARLSCDVSRMLFLIRTALSRDLGNMSNASLYRHSHVNTKVLIDRYITAAVDTISTLVDLSGRDRCDGLEMKYILDQLLAARQAFGRSAVLFSGGATFGMNHIGVLKTLWQAKLLPRIISGASAGSIICAVFCTRTDDELPGLLDTFAYGDFSVFHPEGQEENILQKTARFLKYGSFLDISHLANVMRNWLGDITFQEAYNRTRRILNICVSSAGIYELPKLLNYITAPNVLIWSAVAVSCSVPLVFSPFVLMAKDPLTGEPGPWSDLHKQYIDGSVDGDLPMTRLSEIFNVNHFIVSQVNPHVVPFLPKDDVPSSAAATSQQVTSNQSWLQTLTHLAKDEVLHRMTVMSEFGIFPTSFTKAVSIVNQKYSGDINIYPEIPYTQFPLILKNPTTDFMIKATLSGERATWPKLARIRNHCAIELALDSAIQTMRARVAFSPSQVNLRMNGLLGPSFDYSLDSGTRGRGRVAYRRRSSYSQEWEKTKRAANQSSRRPMHNLRKTRSSLSFEPQHHHGPRGAVSSTLQPSDQDRPRSSHAHQTAFTQLPYSGDGAFVLGSDSDDDDEEMDLSPPERDEIPRYAGLTSTFRGPPTLPPSPRPRSSLPSLTNNRPLLSPSLYQSPQSPTSTTTTTINASLTRQHRRSNSTGAAAAAVTVGMQMSGSRTTSGGDYFSARSSLSPSASKALSPSSMQLLRMTPTLMSSAAGGGGSLVMDPSSSWRG